MYDNFPRLEGRGFNPSGTPKHGRYNEEIRDVAFLDNPTFMLDLDSNAFEIGNDYAEEHYPYYHILEDSPYIHKRDKATSKTQGSQAKVEKKSQRDYNIISFNGKTFSREYARNVRGKRNRNDRVTYWKTNNAGIRNKENPDAKEYLNVHYHYIENMMNNVILDQLALEFGMKVGRTKLTSLQEDYEALSIVDIINSMVGE
jgi:hypothetical protein